MRATTSIKHPCSAIRPGWKSNTQRASSSVNAATDGDQCSLLAVCEVGGTWCLYPHGGNKFGVRLPKDEAERIARAILGQA
ncbi:MAG: hypothetical protein LC808_28785 [Actinobacteria bacterium]|nr:hypothetical protein [Actinomycetota bacterium]